MLTFAIEGVLVYHACSMHCAAIGTPLPAASCAISIIMVRFGWFGRYLPICLPASYSDSAQRVVIAVVAVETIAPHLCNIACKSF